MNDIHTIQPSVNGINEVGIYLKKEAEPPFAIYIQKLLDELNGQWENVCKQVRGQKMLEVRISCWLDAENLGDTTLVTLELCNTLPSAKGIHIIHVHFLWSVVQTQNILL